MPPTLEKLKGHIAFGLCVCVCPCVRYKIYKGNSFEISYMNSSSKIIDTYFLKSGLSPFVELCPF